MSPKPVSPQRTRRALWLRDDDRPRKPRLSRERIVAAAVDLLDAEGVDGFSMRRLAARLQAGTMSLYEYVPSREDVLDLALDAALGEIELRQPTTAPWRDVLAEQATETRRVMLRHPWVPGLVGTRPLLGPASLARSERAYAALHRAGLAGPALVAAISALYSFVHGFVATESTWRTQLPDEADEADLRRQAEVFLAERADLYPTLADHARLGDDDFDAGFALALDTVLDGIAARLPGSPPSRPGP
ncbi:MAG TPA: TetR/AcrR family transcriptional regulator [Acidimicrobiales bacterium]